MSKDKRSNPHDGSRDQGGVLPEEKKPRLSLSSVVMEALKVDNFPKLWPLLEPIFRKVVSILASYNKLAMVVAVHT
jgi:hypothetical protein